MHGCFSGLDKNISKGIKKVRQGENKTLYSEGIHKVIIEVVLVLQRTVCCSSNHLPEGYLSCHLCCSSEMDLLKQKNTLLSSMEAEKRSLEAELQDIQSQLTGKTGLCSLKNFLGQRFRNINVSK